MYGPSSRSRSEKSGDDNEEAKDAILGALCCSCLALALRLFFLSPSRADTRWAALPFRDQQAGVFPETDNPCDVKRAV